MGATGGLRSGSLWGKGSTGSGLSRRGRAGRGSSHNPFTALATLSAAVALAITLVTPTAAMALRRRSIGPSPSQLTEQYLQWSCWIAADRERDGYFARVRTYVDAHQPAPPALVRALETYETNRTLLTVVRDSYWCGPPASLAAAMSVEQARDLYEALVLLVDAGKTLRIP